MFLLTDPMLKTVIYRLKITLFFVRNLKKPERLLIPNFDLSENIGKVVTK